MTLVQFQIYTVEERVFICDTFAVRFMGANEAGRC
jgi:hypothetical protein